MADLVLSRVRVSFNGVAAVDDVSINLDHPFFMVIMGPNGAGKTTLIKSIAGLIKIERGVIRVFNKDPLRDRASLRSIVGYMPQISEVNKDIPLKAIDVASSPLRLINPRDSDLVDRLYRAIEITGIREHLHKPFSALSGGLKQRVLLARALVTGRRLLLLDEPLSMMDQSSRARILDTLYRLHRSENLSIAIVTHDISHCIRFDPYVLLLKNKPIAFGRVKEVLTLDNLSKAYGGFLSQREFVFLGEEHG